MQLLQNITQPWRQDLNRLCDWFAPSLSLASHVTIRTLPPSFSTLESLDGTKDWWKECEACFLTPMFNSNIQVCKDPMKLVALKVVYTMDYILAYVKSNWWLMRHLVLCDVLWSVNILHPWYNTDILQWNEFLINLPWNWLPWDRFAHVQLQEVNFNFIWKAIQEL